MRHSLRNDDRVVETRHDRMELAHEAGFGSISLVSVLAGTLVAYGAFAVIAAIVGGVLNAVGVDTTELSSNDWRQLGIGGAAVAALVLLLSYLFGGYVAGRMARRAGAMNGLFVFILGILVAAGVGAAIGSMADTDAMVENLRSLGVPTTGSEWSAIGTGAGIASLVAMLVGSLLGGVLGERWHGKLFRRAMDPTVGPAADRRDVDLRDRDRDRDHDVELRDRDRDVELTHRGRDVDGEVTRTDTTLDDDLERARRTR